MPGPTELWVILLIVLVIFGGRKLPELARSMGESVKEFRKASEELSGDADKGTKNDEAGQDG